MVTTMVLSVFSIAIILIALRFVHKLYPLDPVEKGKKVNIYQDNAYNRTATVTGLYRDRLVIYNSLPLPLDYRGKFYSVGYTSDGFTFLFLGRKRLYFLARIAELIRKIMRTPEYMDNMPEDAPAETQKEAEEEVEDEL